MNFCMKDHMFTRKIMKVDMLSDGKLMIFFERNFPFNVEYLEISHEEIENLPEVSLNLIESRVTDD